MLRLYHITMDLVVLIYHNVSNFIVIFLSSLRVNISCSIIFSGRFKSLSLDISLVLLIEFLGSQIHGADVYFDAEAIQLDCWQLELVIINVSNDSVQPLVLSIDDPDLVAELKVAHTVNFLNL